jgi:trk system potassium uptake protein TrkH
MVWRIRDYFAVAVLPMLGIGGMQLYRAETPGPMHDSYLA